METEQTNHIRDIEELLHSFAEALSIAIDARSPYNGDHTRRVAGYTQMLIDHINSEHEAGKCEMSFDNTHSTQLVLAAYLHDIGKLAIPVSILNKSSRLGERVQKIRERMRLLRAYWEIDFLKGRCTEEEYKSALFDIDEMVSKVKKLNEKPELDLEDIAYINRVKDKQYISEKGKKVFYLTKYEVDCLSIIHGTLTESERLLIQQHALMTQKMLSTINFKGEYKELAVWAGNHHEYLDGSGYPGGLKAEDLSVESRILTIVDIFDALTSKDRPYKEANTTEEAFKILNTMVKEGKIDKDLTELFEGAYRNNMEAKK
ncbi:MAG: HD domain-containing protein [Eubacterium sp.]|nr:HD domain-containing protein [Eubacterium sp.]